jgi:hypothetical protein
VSSAAAGQVEMFAGEPCLRDLQDLRERPDVLRLQRLGSALKLTGLLQREAVRG